VSGPWRLTVWESPTQAGGSKIYVFSEEHANEGSCPQDRHFSHLAAEVLQKTRGVHVLMENFVHANDIRIPKAGANASLSQACSPVNVGILNNLRNCLEVMKINSRHCAGGCEKRIHFIDPRVDMVSVLPDGKLFEAITHYVNHKASEGLFDDAVLTIFESIVHPLSSLLPDRRNLVGRLVGVFDAFRARMTPLQRQTFDKIWVGDITGGIVSLNAKYVKLHRTYSSSSKKRPPLAQFSKDVEDMKTTYKWYTNKFMDIWLLAHVFMIQNTSGSSGMVMYLGSLHGLQIEKYLAEHGLRKVHHVDNQNLGSCLSV
ncbi:unnamed protein product, partial [Ectocarpus sp. 12 AP-2014]